MKRILIYVDMTKKYTKNDYTAAIRFVLNYPPEFDYRYNIHKDIYRCNVFDQGWYDVKLDGKFVRSALKWSGKRYWSPDFPCQQEDYK